MEKRESFYIPEKYYSSKTSSSSSSSSAASAAVASPHLLDSVPKYLEPRFKKIRNEELNIVRLKKSRIEISTFIKGNPGSIIEVLEKIVFEKNRDKIFNGDDIRGLVILDTGFEEWEEVEEMFRGAFEHNREDNWTKKNDDGILSKLRSIQFINSDIAVDNTGLNGWLRRLFEIIAQGGCRYISELQFRDCRLHKDNAQKVLRGVNGEEESNNIKKSPSFIYELLKKLRNLQERNLTQEQENMLGLSSIEILNTRMDNDECISDLFKWLIVDFRFNLRNLALNHLFNLKNTNYEYNINYKPNFSKSLAETQDKNRGNNLQFLKNISFSGNNLDDFETIFIITFFIREILQNKDTRLKINKEIFFDFSNNFITHEFYHKIQNSVFEINQNNKSVLFKLPEFLVNFGIHLAINLTGNPVCQEYIKEYLHPFKNSNIHFYFDYLFPITFFQDLQLFHYFVDYDTNPNPESHYHIPPSHLSITSSQRTSDSSFGSNMPPNSHFDKTAEYTREEVDLKSTLDDIDFYNSDDDEDYEEEDNEDDEDEYEGDEDDDEEETDSEYYGDDCSETRDNGFVEYQENNFQNSNENQKTSTKRKKDKVLIVQEEDAIESLISETKLNHLKFRKNQEKWT
ncbi:hypothetical protein HWI79_936 [Cryptosporidium felis]|nr:hypothetical protein HWI79_936 [Cryptosporidium felis]